jgi:hypothetical protein
MADVAALRAEYEALRRDNRERTRELRAYERERERDESLERERDELLERAGLSYDELRAVVVRERVARLSEETQVRCSLHCALRTPCCTRSAAATALRTDCLVCGAGGVRCRRA